ncbi:MAG: TetR/AcrR family transcriptional regulator [Deltaproteobacteria bacterium]|nr:TetR/AcrR family transcriptional regulator [Deltaproteobacteria bacterium]
MKSTRASPRAEQILEGLEQIFLGEGFRKVTIGDLVRRLRCSRQTLYQLAETKPALVLRVLDRCLARIRRKGIEASSARHDIRERIVALVEPGVTELRGASQSFFADVAAFPAAKRLLQRHQAVRRKEAEALIRDGIRQGAFRRFDSRLAAEVFFAAVQRVMDPAFLAAVGLSPSDAIRQAEELLLSGLMPRTARRRRR